MNAIKKANSECDVRGNTGREGKEGEERERKGNEKAPCSAHSVSEIKRTILVGKGGEEKKGTKIIASADVSGGSAQLFVFTKVTLSRLTSEEENIGAFH